MSMCEVDDHNEGEVPAWAPKPRGLYHSVNSPLETWLWSPLALNETPGAGDTAQQLRVCSALAEDPNLVPRSLTGWLTISCRSSSKGSDSSGLCGRTPPHNTHIVNQYFKFNFVWSFRTRAECIQIICVSITWMAPSEFLMETCPSETSWTRPPLPAFFLAF